MGSGTVVEHSFANPDARRQLETRGRITAAKYLEKPVEGVHVSLVEAGGEKYIHLALLDTKSDILLSESLIDDWFKMAKET